MYKTVYNMYIPLKNHMLSVNNITITQMRYMLPSCGLPGNNVTSKNFFEKFIS